MIKPGVGETTRVLLRRIPDKILIDPDKRQYTKHIELLAKARGVLKVVFLDTLLHIK